jgi:hypothetical protein
MNPRFYPSLFFLCLLFGCIVQCASAQEQPPEPPPPPPPGYVKKGSGKFNRVQIDPSFTGGEKAWRKFLEQHMNPGIAEQNGAPKGIFTVYIQFLVDEQGKLSNIEALTNHGYGLEDEAIRILRKSPPWTPGIQNGRKVKAYKKQPLTFQVKAKD